MTKEEAIEVYYGLINPKIKEAFEFFVPELCESKDERIRKKCIELIKRVIPSGDSHSQESEEILDCIAYLERQKDVWKERAQNITANMLEDKIEGIQRELIEFLSNTVNASWVDIIQSADAYAERIRNIIEKQKEQKPILEVFGFKVGDAVRLKDGDGRKHIIKSFEEVEGIHGSNFYHVEFEDNSATDGIYPGEEYPNGYYTQMEKFEEEQKPAGCADDVVKEAEEYTSKVVCGEYGVEVTEAYIAGVLSERNRGTEWSEYDRGVLEDAITATDFLGNNKKFKEENPNLAKAFRIAKDWLKSLPERFNLEPKQ